MRLASLGAFHQLYCFWGPILPAFYRHCKMVRHLRSFIYFSLSHLCLKAVYYCPHRSDIWTSYKGRCSSFSSIWMEVQFGIRKWFHETLHFGRLPTSSQTEASQSYRCSFDFERPATFLKTMNVETSSYSLKICSQLWFYRLGMLMTSTLLALLSLPLEISIFDLSSSSAYIDTSFDMTAYNLHNLLINFQLNFQLASRRVKRTPSDGNCLKVLGNRVK